jgi:hypothetical protein
MMKSEGKQETRTAQSVIAAHPARVRISAF